MKKIIFSVMLLCSCSAIYAQLLDIASIKKVDLPQNAAASVSTMSPDGSYMLISDYRKDGLQKYDFTTGVLSTVTTAYGSGYDAKITDDGKTVVFREQTVGKDHLKKTSLKAINLSTGEIKTIVKPTRNLQGVVVSENAVYSIEKRKMNVKSLGSENVRKNRPVVSIEYGQLMITRNGKTTVLSPNGQAGQSYLWPSVSPDGSKVVYYLATQGAYVCNIDGSQVRFIGKIRAPKWYNDGIVVGMNDKDNGEFVTSSEIVAASIDGKESQTLTGKEVIAMYPSVSKSGDKISFTTTKGEAYIINVNIE